MTKQPINFAGANFYTLIKPMEVKMVGAARTIASAQSMEPPLAQPEATRPVVVITGRGKTAGRVSTLVRLRPEVVKEIKSLVDAPLYLTIELALRHYAKDLRTRPPGSVEMIKASDLG
jgi:hypothetical protein